MAPINSFDLLLLVALLGSALSSTCNDEPSFNVSLSLVSDYSLCPKQPITARCIVYRNTSLDYLDWDCDHREGSGTVICRSEHVDDFVCSYGEVYNVTNHCDCTSPVIISEVTLHAPQAGGNQSLYCSNGKEEKNISLEIPELSTPKLIIKNESTLYIDDDHCNVTIMWRTNDSSIFDDLKYMISVSNSSVLLYTLNATNTVMNVTLHLNVNYSIVVNSFRCEGNLVSKFSDVLAAFCKAQTVQTTNMKNTHIIGIVVGVVGVAIAIGVVFAIGVSCFVTKNKGNLRPKSAMIENKKPTTELSRRKTCKF